MFHFKDFFSVFVASGAFVGFLPWCPGTWGSLLGIVLFWFFKGVSTFFQIFLIFLIILSGIVFSHLVSKKVKQDDPEFVVIDEIAGVWISVLGKHTFLEYLLAFVIFRVIDILKPFPLRKIERLKGGIGIMGDDVVAGVITNLLVWLILLL